MFWLTVFVSTVGTRVLIGGLGSRGCVGVRAHLRVDLCRGQAKAYR